MKKLVWDSNSWDIGLDLQDIERDHFKYYLQNAEVGNFSADAHERVWVARYEDELETLQGRLQPGPDGFAAILATFPALRGVDILNGTFEVEDRIVRKTDDEISGKGVDAVERGDNLFEEGTLGMKAFQRVIEGFFRYATALGVEGGCTGLFLLLA